MEVLCSVGADLEGLVVAADELPGDGFREIDGLVGGVGAEAEGMFS